MKPILPLHFRVIAVAGLVLLTRAVHAQTTNDAPATTGGETHITSKMGRFDFNTRSLIYSDDVRVVDPRIELTCEYMVARFPTNGTRRVDTIIAETNVVALISTNGINYRITAAKAVYIYRPEATTTNQLLELTGSPQPVIDWVSTEQPAAKTNVFTARRIVWDLTKNQISAEDQHGTFPDLANTPHHAKTETNATNTVSEPKPITP